MLPIGSVVDGKYKILDKIGQGGMSLVYLAVNERVNKKWAVKEIRKDVGKNYEAVKQSMATEMELLKCLSHPNLPSIVDVIEEDENFMIVMDYIEGKSLSRILKTQGAQPQEKVILWSKQLCDVLEYLHTQNPPIIYRDMKPENVMLKPDGNVVLIDFGAARTFKSEETNDTAWLGTRGYAAPEQYGGFGQTDFRTDIYGLGATMYHLVTGRHPGKPPYEMYPVRRWNRDLSSGLEKIIQKCTRKNPRERYQSCADLKRDLEHCQKIKFLCKGKKNLLPAAVLASILAAMAAAGVFMMERNKKNRVYEQYLTDAKSLMDKEEQFLAYEKAIGMLPRRGEAYLELMDRCFLDDYVLTEEEDEKLRCILGTSSGNQKSNENYLQSNTKAYEAFSYKAAMAYYYYFQNGTNNKNGALKWLEVVEDASTLKPSMVERGRRLKKIAEYYSSIGVQRPEGDEGTTYLEYWNDMVQLTSGNLVQADNVRTALVMYEEFISQMYRHCLQFQQAQVTKEEMEKQIANIENRLNADIPRDEAFKEEIQAIQENIRRVRRLMDTVYG